ncbi:MAG TPA: protein kinase, partial [Planctomycetota bacterium]|nr:protein kinase [Planctomycetota bacterium]
MSACSICGQSVDSTLVRNQFGGACPYCIGALAPEESPAATLTGGEVGENEVEPASGHESIPCGVCGRSVDATVLMNQYGGACPYCMGALDPEESPAAAMAGGEVGENEIEFAPDPAEAGHEITPCGVCGRSVESIEVLNQYGGACPYCIGALVPEGSPSAAPTRPPPTGGAFGKYVLTDRLGKGGMGEVWKAHDTELRRSVALKFLYSEDPMELARFEREAHLAASLSHANIGAIHEIGVIDGRHYIAMQYVQGQTLEKYPKKDRRLMARLMRDACRAVEHAHRNGVIHRDIKPANLMVEEADDGARVVVLDFGIARAIEGGQNLSMTGDIVGTATYMSPEQAKGAKLDERADVYSLGATLYEVLTGRNPFEGTNVYEVLANVVAEEPVAPRRIDPKIPHDLETIVLKCLEKDRDRRYAGAQELADDLDRFLEGEAVHAKRANTIYLLRKKLGKRKAVVMGTVAATLLAAVLGWWLLVGRPHSEYLRFLADGRKLWEEARVAAITGVDPAVIRKKSGAAREQFDGAIRARPDAVGYLMRGRCLALEGDKAGAQEALEKAFELDPGNADARVELARSLLKNYVDSRGMPPFATYGGSLTPYFGALSSEQPKERQWRERAERLLVQGETAPKQQGLLKGLVAMGQGEHSLAVSELAAYTKEERWDADAVLLEAMCRYFDRDYGGVIEALDRSLNLVPSSEGFFWRALAKKNKGQNEEAIADFTKALELDPKRARALMNR